MTTTVILRLQEKDIATILSISKSSMEIFITIVDRSLNFRGVVNAESFEAAEEQFGKIKRNYERVSALALEQEVAPDNF